MPLYSLDSNVFIQAKNGPYGFDIMPNFWEWLEAEFAKGTICMSKAVHDELIAGDDELAEWAKKLKGKFIVDPDEATQKIYQQVADHVNKKYERHHVASFLGGADPWVIAQARKDGATVVTHETLQPEAKKIKIPNVCKQFDVKTINPYEMMRKLGFKGSK